MRADDDAEREASLRGSLRLEQRVDRIDGSRPRGRPSDVPSVDDRQERQTRLHPARHPRIAPDARAEEVAACEVVRRTVRPVPERTAMDAPYERRSAVELDRPAEGELSAEDPVLADVRVSEAAGVPDRIGAEQRRRRSESSCSAGSRARRAGGSGRHARRWLGASRRARPALPSPGSSSRSGRRLRRARDAAPASREGTRSHRGASLSSASQKITCSVVTCASPRFRAAPTLSRTSERTTSTSGGRAGGCMRDALSTTTIDGGPSTCPRSASTHSGRKAQ